MKQRGIAKSFIFAMGVLSAFLVVLWILFYYTTRRAFVNNMIAQAETISGSITSSIEDELLSIDEIAYTLAHYDLIVSMMDADDAGSFYELGRIAAVRSEGMIGTYSPVDNCLILREDGLFYRLKGQISNTAVKRVHHLLTQEGRESITVSVGGMTYVGSCQKIDSGEGAATGYVILLMEKSRLKELMTSFDELEYVGVAVSAGDEMICSDRDISYEDLEEVKRTAAFYKEKAIGLTGFTLHTYCDNSVPQRLGRAYQAALPLTILVLLMVLGVFVLYWNRHIVRPVSTIINSVGDAPDSPIPDTGEQYFDELVHHVNDALERLEDRDRQLYESDIRIKESELVAERTLMSLLKKQINAHFTVNTLNAVRALINKGEKEKAAMICDELSALLRYANAGDEYISIIEEFDVLEQYVSIMQVRFPDRFTFEAEPDDAAAQCYIPRMLIQPIIENSITHGFAEKSGTIRITAVAEKDLVVTVRDDGDGMDPEKLAELQRRLEEEESTADSGVRHVALLNIQKRIRLTCGDGYGLSIVSSGEEGTQVTLNLPLRLTP
ncbi:MAG: histidine kinase [Butyrivibrio sp.]|nr:histidine kinase [Butyrivibrio sp.]